MNGEMIAVVGSYPIGEHHALVGADDRRARSWHILIYQRPTPLWAYEGLGWKLAFARSDAEGVLRAGWIRRRSVAEIAADSLAATYGVPRVNPQISRNAVLISGHVLGMDVRLH